MLGEWYLPPGECQVIWTITEGTISFSSPLIKISRNENFPEGACEVTRCRQNPSDEISPQIRISEAQNARHDSPAGLVISTNRLREPAFMFSATIFRSRFPLRRLIESLQQRGNVTPEILPGLHGTGARDPLLAPRLASFTCRGHHGHGGPFEKTADIVVGRRGKIFVPDSDGMEGIRSDHADAFVDLPSRARHRPGVPRSGRPRPGERACAADSSHGGSHRRAGCQPVIHQDHGAPCAPRSAGRSPR